MDNFKIQSQHFPGRQWKHLDYKSEKKSNKTVSGKHTFMFKMAFFNVQAWTAIQNKWSVNKRECCYEPQHKTKWQKIHAEPENNTNKMKLLKT